jgi:hypothetical protein
MIVDVYRFMGWPKFSIFFHVSGNDVGRSKDDRAVSEPSLFTDYSYVIISDETNKGKFSQQYFLTALFILLN